MNEERIKALKGQTFGVEVEGYGIGKARAAEALAGLFGTAYEGGTVAKDGKGRRWVFKNDGSLDGPRALEFVTPILGYDDLPLLRKVLETLKAAGMKADAGHQDGLHVHVGADGHTAGTILNLANQMRARERLIWEAIGGSEEREHWCRDTDDRMLATLEREAKAGRSLESIDLSYDRYRKLNLAALEKHGTVEFRLFELKGELDADRVEAFVNLALAMNASAKLAKATSPERVATGNPKFAMRTWLNRLGMIGPEFATTRRVLTENLSGNGAWASGTAHEVGYHRAGA